MAGSRKSFKPHTMLFIFTAAVILLSWLVPGGNYDAGYYANTGTAQMGLYNLLQAPIYGFFDAVDIILFVLVIGGFITMVMKTGALEAGVGGLAAKFEGHESILIVILTILFGLGGTTFGMCEETVAFYAVVAPVMLAAGFDVTVALMVIFVGSAVGVLASTVNPFAVGAAVAEAEAVGVTVGLGDGMFSRFLLFIILEAVTAAFIVRYANKVKADSSYSVCADEDVDYDGEFGMAGGSTSMDGRQKLILALFGLTFVIMVLGVIPWAFKFDIMFFDDIFNSIAGSPVGKFLGLVEGGDWDTYDQGGAVALGDWWFGQLSVWFFIMTLVIGFIHSLGNDEFGENEIVETIFEGFKDFISVALVIGVARGISKTLTASGIDATILSQAETLLADLPAFLFGILTFFFYIPMTFLISSTSGMAGATMPIIAPLAENVLGEGGAAVGITAYSMGTGIVNIFNPTGVAIVGCAMLKVPYGKYMKMLAPLLGIIFAICTVYIGILAVMV